jgi:hypothetical protein
LSVWAAENRNERLHHVENKIGNALCFIGLRELGLGANYAVEWRSADRRFRGLRPKHSGFAGDSASQSGYAAGEYRNSSGKHCNAGCGHGNSASYSANHAGVDFPAKSACARANFAGNADTRQHHATVYDQSEYSEHARHFAKRLALWNFTGNGQRHQRIDYAFNPWCALSSGQHVTGSDRSRQRQQHFAFDSGNEPDARESVSAGRVTEHGSFAARVSLRHS